LLLYSEVSYHNKLPLTLTHVQYSAEIRLSFQCSYPGRGHIKTIKGNTKFPLQSNAYSIAPLWIYLKLYNLTQNSSDCDVNQMLYLRVRIQLTSDQLSTYKIFNIPVPFISLISSLPSLTQPQPWNPLQLHAIKRHSFGPVFSVVAVIVSGFLLSFLFICSFYCYQRAPQHLPLYDPFNYRLRRPYNHYTVYPPSRLNVQSPRPNRRSATCTIRVYLIFRKIAQFFKSFCSCVSNVILWLCLSVRSLIRLHCPGLCCETHPYSSIPTSDQHEI